MNATFSLLSLVQHLMRTTVSNKNRVTHGATSTTFFSGDKLYDKAMLFLSLFSLMNNTTNFKWLNSCRKPENMRIQEILPTQKLIHRRQVTGYPIATQCCI